MLVPFDAECAQLSGEIAGSLLRVGATVGVADVLIASTAIVRGAVLATANVDHHQRMLPFGLKIENWRESG